MLGPRHPSLRLRFSVQGLNGEVDAAADTGFDGYLAIPEHMIREFSGEQYQRYALTASGQTVLVSAYVGTVELVDQPGTIPALIIALGHNYRVGMAILNHFRVCFDHGREVTVER